MKKVLNTFSSILTYFFLFITIFNFAILLCTSIIWKEGISKYNILILKKLLALNYLFETSAGQSEGHITKWLFYFIYFLVLF